MTRVLVSLGLSCVLALSCAPPALPARADGPTAPRSTLPLSRPLVPLLRAGERFEAIVERDGATFATVSMAISGPCRDGSRERPLSARSHAEGAGVARFAGAYRAAAATTFDDDTLPVWSGLELDTPERSTTLDTWFSVGGYSMRHQRAGKPPRDRSWPLPPKLRAHDVHAALGVARALSLEPDGAVMFYALAGRRLWRLALAVAGRDQVEVSGKRRPAIRVDGEVRRMFRTLHPASRVYRTSLWLSHDPDRVPLRLRIDDRDARYDMTLRHYARTSRVASPLPACDVPQPPASHSRVDM
jgi:hypothetical protein